MTFISSSALQSRLLTGQFNSKELIVHRRAPVMVLHGRADSNISVTEARRLYSPAPEPKTVIEVEGAEHSNASEGGAEGNRPSRGSGSQPTAAIHPSAIERRNLPQVPSR